MNQLLITPGEILKLNEDMILNSYDLSSGKWSLYEALVGPARWPLPDFTVTIVAGTVGRVGNYRIRNNGNARYSYIPLLVLDSPDKRLMPKSRGGTGKRVNLFVPFTLFKTLDIERFVPNE